VFNWLRQLLHKQNREWDSIDVLTDLLEVKSEKSIILYGGLCIERAGYIMVNVPCLPIASYVWHRKRTPYSILAWIYGVIYPKHWTFELDWSQKGLAKRKQILAFVREGRLPFKKLVKRERSS
jgi:hypothetical protein